MVEWQIRQYREGDAPKMAANFTAAFAADGLDFMIPTDEVLSKLSVPGFDAGRQALVVEGPTVEGLPDGMIPGFAWLDIRDEEDERVYGPRISAHPAVRPLGLERLLAKRLIDMARQHEADPNTKAAPKVRVRESFSPKQKSQHKLYSDMGLRQTRVYWTMVCALDGLPEPQPVDGVRMRHMSLPQDTVSALDALNNSFIDHYDFHQRNEEQWAHRLAAPDFRPDLSWVAEIEAEPWRLAGFCLCGVIEEENRSMGRLEGWIQTLGTVRGWRGKGLGRALLLHGLHSLKGAGLETGMLGVDATNPTGATNLYESVGFKVHDEWLQYGCPLDEVKI